MSSFSSRSLEEIENDENPASVLEFFSLTLDYQLAKCGTKDIKFPVGSEGLVTAAQVGFNPLVSGSDHLAVAKSYAGHDSEYDSADTMSTNSHGNDGKHALRRSELANKKRRTTESQSTSVQIIAGDDHHVQVATMAMNNSIEKDRNDFQTHQANRDLEMGDKILHRYIVEEKWAYRRCRKLFAVGWSRYSKLKSGQPFATIIARGGGRLTRYDSCYRHAVYLSFAKYLEKCVKVDQTGKFGLSLFLVDGYGNPVNPNYRKWNCDRMIYEDYLLFVDALNVAKRGHCVKAYSPCSFVNRIKFEKDIQYRSDDICFCELYYEKILGWPGERWRHWYYHD